MANSFEESVNVAENRENNEEDEEWQEGDRCGKDGCDHEVIKREHPRNPQIGTPRHPEAPEVEFVCTHHGIVGSR